MKYQITRMKSQKQQHYNIKTSTFEDSADCFDGEFKVMAPYIASNYLKRAIEKYRKSNTTTIPKLEEIK